MNQNGCRSSAEDWTCPTMEDTGVHLKWDTFYDCVNFPYHLQGFSEWFPLSSRNSADPRQWIVDLVNSSNQAENESLKFGSIAKPPIPEKPHLCVINILEENESYDNFADRSLNCLLSHRKRLWKKLTRTKRSKWRNCSWPNCTENCRKNVWQSSK